MQFISDLLDYVESNLCVDTSRVYAAGVSNGGGMAALLACQLSARFAAFASIAGGYSSLPPCQPTNPVRSIEVHGTADGVGALQRLPAGPRRRGAAVAGGLARARRLPRPARRSAASRRGSSATTGPRCAEGTAVEHIEIFGGDHQLPGGLPPDRGQTSTVSATVAGVELPAPAPPGPALKYWSSGGPDGMILVIGRVRTDPDRRAALVAAGQALVAASRAEPGCISYRLYEDTQIENDFVFVEEWESEQALRRHFATPHVRDFMRVVPARIVAPPDVKFHTVTSSMDLADRASR